IAGRDAATHGEAKNSWLTGTAAWNYVAITQWILGIRPTYHGLQIAPRIPRAWSSFDETRLFRCPTCHFTVKREGEGTDVSIVVDGQPIDGEVIPLADGASTRNVLVTVR